MRRKLIINESQLKSLKLFINENEQSSIISKIVGDLNSNYKKAIETYRENGEYKEKKVFEVIIDGEIITPIALMSYISDKYSVSEKFVIQLLDDWCNNSIVNNTLSKNIPMT